MAQRLPAALLTRLAAACRRQDALALPPAALKSTLQPLLRRQSALKLGFALKADLRALAGALGGEGGGVVAVVAPALDVGSLHRALLAAGAPVSRVRGARLQLSLLLLRVGARAWALRRPALPAPCRRHRPC